MISDLVRELRGEGSVMFSHVSIPVQPGKLGLACEFFEVLGWERTEAVQDVLADSVVVIPDVGIFIRLTEIGKVQPKIPDVSVGVAVGLVKIAQVRLNTWATGKQIQLCWRMIGPEGVSVLLTTDIFPIALRFDSMYEPCPECKGLGKIRRGREGQVFTYDCGTCEGTGLDPEKEILEG